MILTAQDIYLCCGQQHVMFLFFQRFFRAQYLKSMTKFKHLGFLGFPFLLPVTSAPSLISPASRLIILYSEGRLPIYLTSTVYQALHIIFILKATLWGRSNYPIFIIKETGSGMWSIQYDPTGEWHKMGRKALGLSDPQERDPRHLGFCCCLLPFDLLPFDLLTLPAVCLHLGL